MSRDERPWLERMLGAEPAEGAFRRAVTLLTLGLVHLGRGTTAEELTREATKLDRWS